jgi:TP901 family phage tail tape measure protein
MTLGQLIASLGVDTTSIDSAVGAMQNFEKKANSSINNVQKSLDSVSRDMMRFGKSASLYLTAPLALAGGASFKMSMDFEQSMQTIVGLVGVSQKQVDEWASQILEMAPKLGKAPKELADALYFVTSSGFKSAEAMDIVVQSAKAASAGLGDTIKIADLATSAMNAYKDSNLSAAKVMDVLTAAVREGKGEASQFSSEMGEVIPIAARMGVSFDQIAAAMAAMTLTGSTVEESATYMRQILVSLLDPVKGAEEALRQMGTSGALMRKELREKGLLSSLETLDKLTRKFGDDMIGKVFGNIRALTGDLSLMGDRLKENKILFKVVNDSLGDSSKAFQVASDTIRFKYNAALSEIKIAAITLGLSMKESLIPMLEWFAKAMANISIWYSSLSRGQQQWLVGITAFIAVLGPLAIGLSLIIKSFSALYLVGGKVIVFLNTFRLAILANPILGGTFLLAVLGTYAAYLLLVGKNAGEAADKHKKFNDELQRAKELLGDNSDVEKRMAVVHTLTQSQLSDTKQQLENQIKLEEDFTTKLLIELKKRRDEDQILKDYSAQLQQAQSNELKAGILHQIKLRQEAIGKELEIENIGSQNRIKQYKNYLAIIENLIKKSPAKTVKIAVELSDEQKIMKELTKEIERVNAESLLMGRTYEINEQLLKVYTSALEKFSAANITTGNSVNFATGMFNALSETLEKSKPEKKVKEITDYAKELQKELALVAYENSIMRDGWDYSEAQRNIDALTSRLQIYRSEMMRLKELQIDTFNKKGIIDPQTTADLTAATTQVSLLQSQLSVLEAQQYIVDNLGNAFSKLGGAIGGTAGEWLSWFGNMVETVPEILKFINAIAVATGMQTAKTAAQTTVTGIQTGVNATLAASNTATAATTAVQTVAVIALAHALTAAAVAGALASAAWIPFPANLAAMATAAETLSALLVATNVQAQAAISVGLKSGGIVPPGYPNDSYPAMLTSGEMVTPPGKLPKQELSAATIELKGKFKIEGPDLVYILDKQTMKNNLI